MRFNPAFGTLPSIPPIIADQSHGFFAERNMADVSVRVSRCRNLLVATVRTPLRVGGMSHSSLSRLLRSLNRRTTRGTWRIDGPDGLLVLSGTLPLVGGRGKLGKAAARFVVALIGETAMALPTVSFMAQGLRYGPAFLASAFGFGRN